MGSHEGSAFGTLLRSYRLAAGLSQERLAERASLSMRGISDLERGARRSPRLETVRMLAEGLDLAAEDRVLLLQAAQADPPLAHGTKPEPIRSRLPLPPTPLVGRERDLATIMQWIEGSESRLITLTGPGGVGKTRLAQEVALKFGDQFTDGACIVTLVAVTDDRFVLPAVASALGLPESPTVPLLMALEHFLASRHLLLILDNFEHVLGAAPDVATLLSASAGLQVLATSRMPLQLRGERLLPISPLAFPDTRQSYSVAALEEYGAVKLFAARIKDVKPGFSVDAGNAEAIIEICRRLDGLPLALELAAVRAKMLTPHALLQRLERRLPLLTGGSRDLPTRQQTLRAAIAWSYDLLSPDQQTLFRRLGVFPGGWTLESAEAVAATGITLDIVEALAALVDASMVHVDDTQGHEHRYTMLETVREFALEQLEASNEAVVIRSKLVDYFLRLAETDEADLSDAAQRRWEARVTAEHGNIRAALAWLRDHGGNRKGVRLVTTLGGLWSAHNGKAESRSWMAAFLDPSTGPELPPRDRIAALRILGSFAGLEDDRAMVEVTLRESLDLARREGDAYGVYTALNAIGQTRLYGGDVEGSTPLLEEAIRLARAAGDWRETASTLAILAYAVGIQDQLERAEGLAAEALALAESYGAPRGFEATVTILAKGWFALIDDALAKAEQRFQAALDLSHDLDIRAFESSALAGLGNVALARGLEEDASSYFREGVVAGWDGDFPLVLVKNLMGVVDIVVRHREFNRAAHLIGAVDSFGNVFHAAPMVIRRRYESDIVETQRMLGEDRFEDERLRGMVLRPAEIVAAALGDCEDPKRSKGEDDSGCLRQAKR